MFSNYTMADTQTAAQTADTTQQVTSQIPVTHAKNPKRVAAGKAIAEKRRQAREEQKTKLAEADAIMANERLRKAQEEARKAEAVVEVAAAPAEAPATAPAKSPAEAPATMTTTQMLSVASIIVSLVAIFYKREELKGALAKIKAPAKAPTPVVEAPKKKSGIRPMD